MALNPLAIVKAIAAIPVLLMMSVGYRLSSGQRLNGLPPWQAFINAVAQNVKFGKMLRV